MSVTSEDCREDAGICGLRAEDDAGDPGHHADQGGVEAKLVRGKINHREQGETQRKTKYLGEHPKKVDAVVHTRSGYQD